MDDDPLQEIHRRCYSSMRLALQGMDSLIKANLKWEYHSQIAMDRDFNPMISIVEREMDCFDF